MKTWLLLIGTAMTSFVASAEQMTPTLYHLEVIDLQKNTCEAADKTTLKVNNSSYSVDLCKKSYKKCSIEGSCLIFDKYQTHLVNVKSFNARTAVTSWIELNLNRCSSGVGSNDVCLDPFYSVAADLSEYKLGDVVFVPSLKGALLPDGNLHTGFLIVRDTHELLNGAGANRLHFFTGTFKDTDAKNPFVKLKLDEPSNHLPFEKVQDAATIAKVRNQRNYPLIPGANAQEGLLK